MNTTERVYDFIQTYMQTHQIAPTIRDISRGCYLGTSTVFRHLDRLEGEGRITRTPGQARSIVLLEPDPTPTP